MIGKKIRVAIIGAGNMAFEHIRAFYDFKEVELIGIYSRTLSRAELIAEKYKSLKVYSSIKELYSKTEADLVIVAVPVLSVYEVCLEVFKYPWVSLIEKPVGYNLAEAQKIFLIAKKTESRAYVALNRRYYSSTQQVVRDLYGSQIPRLIHILDQEDQDAARSLNFPELVIENWMYANSIHLIDLFRIFGRGKIVSIDPVIRWNPRAPSFVIAKITFNSGDIGIYEAVWNGPGPWAVIINNQEKRWEMRPLEQAFTQTKGSRIPEAMPVSQKDKFFKPGLHAQAHEALKAAKGLPHSLPDLAEVIESMDLVNKIYTAN